MKFLVKAAMAALLGLFLFQSPAQAANWFQNYFSGGRASNNDSLASYKERRPADVRGAAVIAYIDISAQTFTLEVNGKSEARWAISSGRAGFPTPRGSFRVARVARVYFSKKYDNAPMPNSVFFLGGYAIHGTYQVANLGQPVSHGCVRLAPANAAAFFDQVQKYGMSRTRVIVVD